MFYCAVVHPGPAVSHWVHDRSPVVVAMNGWGGTAPLPEASAADIDILVTSDIAVDKDVVKKDVVRCRRCKSTDVAWKQVQTRSADEPMSIFYECKSCGSKWRN